MTDQLLQVSNLVTTYKTVYGSIRALDGIDLSIVEGESVALVGESGSGKSTLGLSIVKLLPLNCQYSAGEIVLEGRSIVPLTNSEMRNIRGRVVFMIFQDPLNSLNPVKKIGPQVLEALHVRYRREGKSLDDAEGELIDALKDVRIPDPRVILERFPHQLSGGQIQRVIIAMGLLMKPKLLIADEPTSAIDVTLQAQILKLLNVLKKEHNMSLIFITHDISVAYTVADKIGVMYAGKLVEVGPSDEVIMSPSHPYTKGLISSLPSGNKKQGRLKSIQGTPASVLNPPPGCRYHPRCPFIMEICRTTEPALVPIRKSTVACWLYSNESAKQIDDNIPGQSNVAY